MSGQPHVDPYQDEAGEYRWRIVGGNGEIIATSSEGYTDKRDRDRSPALALDALDDDGEG